MIGDKRVVGDEVLIEYYNDGKNISEKHYLFNRQICLLLNGNVVNVSIQDWQGNSLPYESVNVEITGEDTVGNVLEPVIGECADGTIELDAYVTGDKLAIKVSAPNMRGAELEVAI
jgi:hypothetical protein